MTTSTDLSTAYLGFRLPHPFIVGASPLAGHLDMVRRLEDAGSAAIVMHSLFEEQITAAQTGRIDHLDPFDKQFATVLSYFPEPEHYTLGPDEYLEQLRRIKSAVKVPVIASLNGTSAESWLSFGQQMAQAGADTLELNLYDVVSAILQHGPAYLGVMREGLAKWMEAHTFTRLDDVRGRLSLANSPDPSAFERANYMRTLSSWSVVAPTESAADVPSKSSGFVK